MKILIISIIYFLVFFCCNFFLFKKNKYKNVILVFIAFLFTFNLTVIRSYWVIENGNLQYIQINSVLIALFLCLFFVYKKTQFLKPGIELILFIPLTIQVMYQIGYLNIMNYANFYNILTDYISIYLIILIYRSLNHINFNNVLYSVNYLAILNGILGILQYITGKALLIGSFNVSILYTDGVVATKRVFGLAGASNAAGTFGALLFGIVLYNLVKHKNLFSFVSLLMTGIFTILTFTRVGYFAMIIELIIFTISYKPKKVKNVYLKLTSILFSIPLVVLIFSYFSSGIIDKLFTQRGDTASQRFYQFQRVFQYILPNNWFSGVGMGQYTEYLAKNYNINDLVIHSQYLNVLAEQGIFMFLLFVFFNFGLFYKIVKSKNIDQKLKVLVTAIFIANFLCTNFNPNEYYYLNNVFYYFIFIGIYFSSKNNKIMFSESNYEEVQSENTNILKIS